MSKIAGIAVMPALSMRSIEILANGVLELFQPAALAAPEPIDVVGWVDRILPRFGVHVMPAGDGELGDMAAVTYPAANWESEILVREWIWNDLAHDPHPNFARATVMHELGHAILHVPLLRGAEQQTASAPGEIVPAFSDPEWQAWALAGAIMMPRRAIAALPAPTAAAVASAFGVSEQFAAVHLRRLKISPQGV